MDKIKVFEKEIGYLKSLDLVEPFKKMINLLPEYFFEEAASTAGKYHPKFSLGLGGLARHTKVAVRIGYELLNDSSIGDKYTDKEKDLMIIALTMHDGLKCGLPKEKYARADHPLLICNYLKEHEKEIGLKEEDLEFICHVISSHMGPWNTDYLTKKEILPKPKDKYQNFVHMCDYIASRKFLNVEFDKEDNIANIE